ncbi:MAG TPA: MFS transporter [Chloroflexota bacterium]|nr:MFS transporter [Chloroflexota bacterium]
MPLLRIPGFRLLLAGFFLSALAPWAQRTAMLIWVFSLTHSGVMVSLVGLMEALPLLVLAPLAGVFVDRWSRARTMAGAVLCQALALTPLLFVHDRSGIPIILVVTLLVNSMSQFFMPAANAAIPVVVGQEGVGAANSLIQMINSFVLILSPALSSLLFALIGPHGLFLVLIVIYVLAAPLLIAVPAPRPAEARDGATTVLAEMRAGLAYVRRSSVLMAIVAVAFVALLGAGAMSVLDVVFVTRALHLRSETVGFLLTASGLGQLVGGLMMLFVSRWAARRYHRLLALSIIASALCIIVYAVAPTLPVAVVALFCSGLAFTPLIVSFMSLIQIVTEDAFMGRVMSLVNTGMAVAMVVSLASGGALADLFGVRQVIGGGAGIFLLSGVLTLALVRSTPRRPAASQESLPAALPTPPTASRSSTSSLPITQLS